MKQKAEEIDIRLIKARANVRMRQPFLGAVAMTMRVTARPGIVTMCTDGRDMFYDPDFLDMVTEAELTGVVAEEAYHKANKHHLRRKGREPDLWNIACDYQIHNDLLKDGFKFPKSIIVDGQECKMYHDPQYDGLAAEDIYHLLKQERDNAAANAASDTSDQGDVQSGDEDDDIPEGEEDRDDGDNEPGEDTSENEGETDPEEDEAEEEQDDSDSGDDDSEKVESEMSDGMADDPSDNEDESDNGKPQKADAGAQAIADLVKAVTSGVGAIIDAPDANADIETEIALQECISVAKRAGNMPGYLQKLIKELVEPRTDWRTELRRFLSPSFAKDTTWTRPNRRVIGQGIILPGYISDGVNNIVIVVDDSGSVDEPALRRVFSEAQSALDEGKVDKVIVIYCDTEVHNEREYHAGETIEVLPARQGGTKFVPAFEWIAANAPDTAGVVYFTDMEAFDWPAVNALEFQPPTLWAQHGDPRRFREYQPAFGDRIEINYE